MQNENGLEIDFDAIREVLEKVDVLTIGFTTFPERMLVDARSSQWEGPLVAIVGPVATVQERYQWLGQHRGTFGAPDGFTFFVWPQSVRSLVANDVLGPLRRRLASVSNGADAALEETLRRLLAIEREAVREAIRGGEGWQTVWERVAA